MNVPARTILSIAVVSDLRRADLEVCQSAMQSRAVAYCYPSKERWSHLIELILACPQHSHRFVMVNSALMHRHEPRRAERSSRFACRHVSTFYAEGGVM